MAKDRVTLIVRDKVDESRMTYSSWSEAHDHIRTVVLGQIINELAELALQEDAEGKEELVEELKDIAKDINYPDSQSTLEGAVLRWGAYADNRTGFTIVEIV